MPQVKYEQDTQLQYTALSDGEAEIYLPEMIGCRVVQIERNIKPEVNFLYNNITGKMTMQNALGKGETLFIIYAKIIIK